MPRETALTLPVAMVPAVVLAIDHVLETCRPSRAVEGLLDELAHVATALALLAPLTLNADRAKTLGALAGAILLDADHVPGELGLRWLTRGTRRPYPHTLLSALVLGGIGMGEGRRWRRFAWPVAAGVATHLLRDLATGGAPLFWPLTWRNVRLPYPVYATLLGAAVLAVGRRQGSCKSNAPGVS